MERRKHFRYEISLPVSFSGEGLDGNGRVLNLSKRGCVIESDMNPSEGDYLVVLVHLPGRETPMRVDAAAVRWTRGRHFGLEFLYKRPEEGSRLNNFIDSL